ncbi:MAG TPA: dihydroorotate dehydrogenase, partial [Roseiflexaceae bacterium]|nr:dihydroorotate dehydrogenase [Roseiflexaceae bacterium]
MIDLAPNNPYGLRLASPMMTAAGCFGYGVEYARAVPLDRIGAIVTRSVALHARRAAPPRLVETPAGLLSVGPWAGRGLKAVLERYAAAWAAWKIPVILSVEADHAAVAEALEGEEAVAGLELRFDDPAEAARTVAEVRARTLLPLLVKLPPHDALAATAWAVADAGADALTVIAAPPALVMDPRSGERLEGRLSGPAIRPLALRAVAEVCAVVSVPV